MSDSQRLSAKLTEIALRMKAGQAFIYDPADRTFSLSTNISVAGPEALRQAINSRQDDEFLEIHRDIDAFDITFVCSAKL